MRVVLRRIRLTALALLAFLVFLGAATSQGHTSIKTALFIPQIVPAFPIQPQMWLTRKPTRTAVQYPLTVGFGEADLYTPAGERSHSAVLLFLGVNPAGRDDPRVVGLAEGLARAGVIVMVPWSDTMTQKRVTIDETDRLVRAYEFLLSQERVDRSRAGMGGFCVGASFVTVAATDPRIRESVKFVNFFGGYFDARDLVVAVTSESRFYGDTVEVWTPDRLSREVVAQHLIGGLAEPSEALLLAQVFITEGATLTPSAIASLSQEAQAVYSLLSSPTLDEARTLINELSDSTTATLASISPATTIENLDARVLIMHDRQDELVPSEESRRLAEALSDRGDVYYTEFSLFRHLDPTRTVSPPVFVKEVFKLYMHMYNVLRDLR